jgi:hypothetical protein
MFQLLGVFPFLTVIPGFEKKTEDARGPVRGFPLLVKTKKEIGGADHEEIQKQVFREKKYAEIE